MEVVALLLEWGTSVHATDGVRWGVMGGCTANATHVGGEREVRISGRWRKLVHECVWV